MAADLPTRHSLLRRLHDLDDEEAWSRFVALYTPLIFGFCRGRGLSDQDAADVTQETLQAVTKSISRFDYDPRRSSFRNWLFTVVRSKLNNFLAAQARKPSLAGETTLDHFVAAQLDDAAEEVWLREYHSNLVHWAARQIQSKFNAQTWDAFWRTAMNGESAESVARELGLTLNALYIARSRVTQKLRRMVQEHDDEGGEILNELVHG